MGQPRSTRIRPMLSAYGGASIPLGPLRESTYSATANSLMSAVKPSGRAAVNVFQSHAKPRRDARPEVLRVEAGKHYAGRDAGTEHQQHSVGTMIPTRQFV